MTSMSDGFREFDAAWSAQHSHRTASMNGVRETYYTAGYQAGAAENARLRERVAALEAAICTALSEFDYHDELSAIEGLKFEVLGPTIQCACGELYVPLTIDVGGTVQVSCPACGAFATDDDDALTQADERQGGEG